MSWDYNTSRVQHHLDGMGELRLKSWCAMWIYRACSP